ncbi:unnamed protein product [Prorocentrum cordatum]|uniref:EF-hand domain-containing protein n=1 Tax=Prorocentrum cordatum TaxID=2364126 RepID=A0ABN9TJY2_9DINO|nr:unnamed protein product [Polarella glacialis]
MNWNILDVGVVLGALADVVMEQVDTEGDILRQTSVLRLIRLLRVVRVLRILRSFVYLRDMRIMVSMLCSALVPLAWIICIIGLLCMTVAIFFTDGASGFLRERGAIGAPIEDERLRHYYGDLFRSICTLYMSITGGVDWEDVVIPLERVSVLYVMCFYVFIAFSTFAMLNVVTWWRIFIDSTIQRSKNDREFIIHNELEGKREFVRTMDALFAELDYDQRGEISVDDLQKHLKVPKVDAYFRTMDLDIGQVKKFFTLLDDSDKSGTISREEFIVGCSRLRGDAKD